MSQCLNPDCLHQNEEEINICQKCGTKLLLSERYRALKILGKGGFGRTFLAIDLFKPSKPKCVIKQFLPNLKGKNVLKKAAELFAQEAVRLDDLGKHEQIPELLAYFDQEERQYLLQEFIDGDNLLQELTHQGAFDEKQIRELLKDMLSVLQFVHANNVIHRDIKPENIIRRKHDGKLILVDFGAAKAADLEGLGVTGTVIGSAGYIAPEQSRGKPQFSSDLYSLGVTCLHLLTNVDPLELFDLGEDRWIWRYFLTQRPVSQQLGQVIDKLVEKAIKRRFASVEEVLLELEATSSVAIEKVSEISEIFSSPTSLPSPAPMTQQHVYTINATLPSPREFSKSPEITKVVTSPPRTKPKTKLEAKIFEFETATVLMPKSSIAGKQSKLQINLTKLQINLSRRKAKSVSIDLGEGIVMELVAIPAGKFLMGSQETEAERGKEESPQHEVTVPACLLSKYPVTQAQWQILMKNNPSRFQKDGLNRPVERVSWFDCLLFCQKLSELVGRKVRLPTEAEWEYATRAGTTGAFYCGETLTTDLANYNGEFTYEYGLEGENRRQTTNVNTFHANPFGLHDLHGNVAEWCMDTWHDSYNNHPRDGSAWIGSDEKEARLLRGGSWLHIPGSCRSASRLKALPNTKSDAFGFRVAIRIQRSREAEGK